MADPSADYKPIAMRRDHPIVTQAWAPPYKPAALPLPSVWQSVMMENSFSSDPKASRGTFFASPTSPSKNPQMAGGKQWTGGGTRGAASNNNNTNNNGNNLLIKGARPGAANAAATAKNLPGSSGGGGGGSGFNSFLSAGRGAANNNSNFGNDAFASAFGKRPNVGGMLDDEDDEYDDRVDYMRHQMLEGGGATAGIRGFGNQIRKKTKAERDQAREVYRKYQEQKAQGFHSGGEVDDGCIAPLGDDDDMRGDRLRFTPGAANEDGTGKSAYAAAIVHRRRGHNMRTPPPDADAIALQLGDGGIRPYTPRPGGGARQDGFHPAGVLTPAFDPHEDLPGPVARFQKRQKHHVLRMLGGGPPPASAQMTGMLFPPHEIPAEDVDRKKNKFDPAGWMLGDESVDDVLKKHFLRDAKTGKGK